MEKDELKPCPICGGKAHINSDWGKVWVECEKCQCSTAVISGPSPIETKIDIAISGWNRMDERE